MPDLIVPIKYSYPVHFIRTRCRLMETAIVQADGVVVVQSATCAEAPSAFRVERACPGHTKPFEVRYYETSFWWPVGDDSDFATSVDFLRGLAEGNKHYLGLLDGKIVSHKGELFSSEEHLREKITIREIKMWGQDKIFALAQKGAFELLLCDGVVHVRGGDPVTCVRFMEATEAPTSTSWIPPRLPKLDGIVLALQLPFLQISESMGNHDSKIVDATSVD